MQYGIYTSAAGALAMESRLDVVANNLANADTPGFRRGYAVFQQRLTEALEPPLYEPQRNAVLDELGGGLFVHEVAFDERSEGLNPTSNTFDVALQGDGWFAVRHDGEELYTRAGNFIRNQDGRLVTADGQSDVLDVEGNPIDIPGVGGVVIDENGVIHVNDEPVAQLARVGSVDYRAFRPTGENLYRHVGQGELEPATGRVRQGFLEHSTVNSVREMVEMIRTFRAYESNQRMITQQDESFGRAVNDIGRSSS